MEPDDTNTENHEFDWPRKDLNLHLGVQMVGTAVLCLLIFATPVAAAETAATVDVCEAEYLSGIVNALIQLSVYGGGIGMFLTYVGTSTLESLPNIGREQERSLKQIRGKGLTAGLKVFLAGPIALLVINSAGLPWADCIDLVPF